MHTHFIEQIKLFRGEGQFGNDVHEKSIIGSHGFDFVGLSDVEMMQGLLFGDFSRNILEVFNFLE